MDEVALIQEAKKGDVNAYNRLVLHYQQAAYNVAYRIMGEPQAAEDATQEAFISAYKALNRFRGGSFKSWLMRITTNACYDELRRRKRRPQSSLDQLTQDNESFSFLRSPGVGPEEQQQILELMQAVEHCLQTLPDDQRITAVLRDVEGYDYKEIAEITRVSLGTVKSRMSRARTKLRECLQGFKELLPLSYRLSSST
ncbi:MAG: sigma-70 family RNA polymerase sigma factor [Chloroflexi bacterium]|jgi:RNA polymerase sigma-70 factor (ECF subfamily)|nr:sigma-70 family RNA polymerase sigma factor [Chloroflexota bacterium]